jgi:hypothetical protein
MRPVTIALIDIIDVRRDREGDEEAAGSGSGGSGSSGGRAAGGRRHFAEEGRELLQSIVDFTETVVREVMTPRPDIVAVRGDATLQD